MKLLAIPGSLRSDSSNRSLLEAAAALAPEDVTVRLSAEGSLGGPATSSRS